MALVTGTTNGTCDRDDRHVRGTASATVGHDVGVLWWWFWNLFVVTGTTGVVTGTTKVP